jgi:hypothetical protein
MAKSSKKSKEIAVPESKPAAPGSAADNGESASRPETPVRAKGATAKAAKPARSAKSAGKERPKTTAAARKPRAGARRKNSGTGEGLVSDEEVRLRAYFISERRVQNGLPGDSAHDWLEAQRQLQDEAGKRA